MQTRKGNNRWYRIGCLFLALLFGQVGLWTGPTMSSVHSSLRLSFKNDRLSAHIERVPLGTVLEVMTAKLPVTFTLKGIDRDSLLSTSFENLPFDQGLQHLLVQYDYAILHSSTDTFPSQGLAPMEVVILSRNPEAPKTVSHIEPVSQILKNNVQPSLFPFSQDTQIQDQESSVVSSHEKEDRDFIPLLEQALGESNPETSLFVQDLLYHLKSVQERVE